MNRGLIDRRTFNKQIALALTACGSLPRPCSAGELSASGSPDHLTHRDRDLLRRIQRKALGYFLDNQLPHGLVLDRQSNFTRKRRRIWCSTSATGMGLVALALSARPEYALLPVGEAVRRVEKALGTALTRLPQQRGIMPHFLTGNARTAVGADRFSTIDSAWLIAGALCAARLLDSPLLESLAGSVYRRVDWGYWTRDDDSARIPLLSHGMDGNGRLLPSVWDRINAETAFMYVLATGARPGAATPRAAWSHLDPSRGSLAGKSILSADLGLFVFQYSLEVLDSAHLARLTGLDLADECRRGVSANFDFCRSLAGKFRTFRHFWGISAGDGPPDAPGGRDCYRAYSPLHHVDGTAHITATIASIGVRPELVLENLHEARNFKGLALEGRYGFSNVNLDANWVSRDVVGIDLGAAVMALDNFLHQGRVRQAFQSLDCVRRAQDAQRPKR